MKTYMLIALANLLAWSCSTAQDKTASTANDTPTTMHNRMQGDTVVHSDTEWHKLLSDEEYRILREKGTERAFTGDLLDNKHKGVYTCAACGNELFVSDTKFESGTGWPSFFTFIEGRVIERSDNSYGMERIEVVCARCDGHLGHVFDDGPAPTGLRYCINSASMDFEER